MKMRLKMNTLEKTHFNDFTENCHLKEWGFLGKVLTKNIVNHIHYGVFISQLKPLSNGCVDSISVLNDPSYNIEFFKQNYELIKDWLLKRFGDSDDIAFNIAIRFAYKPTKKAIESIWLNNNTADVRYIEMANMITKIIAIETAVSFNNFIKFQTPL